jgi:hypothetical protein
MNVSTLGPRNAKTYLKNEDITGKKADVIFVSDVRAKDKGDELKKLMGLTRNGSYKHSWARNLKKVAPQKQNAICKTRAQCAKRNCAFELFKAHCAATINARNSSFHKICF